ncbi:hypothetical protein C8Q78DRAFT_46838 [Trametes maxima]|nr:hypothetical protein C8Q78DRAFT_46838 [Trametes maxima]
MSESYDATFRWPHPGASDVIVTGSFDSWSCSHHLHKTRSGVFEGVLQVPWGETVQYKYIVDGRWTTTDDQPTELDPIGNLNNVLRAPARPPSPKPAPRDQSTAGRVNGFVTTAKQAAVSIVEALAPGTAVTPAQTPVVEKAEQAPTPSEPAPAPAPAPPAPEPAATEITSEAVLPTSPAPAAPEVPVTILPLSTEPPSEATSIPSADVSESKPLETTVVEGSATAETTAAPAAVVPLTDAPAPAPTPAPAPEPVSVPAADVSASKLLDTAIVEGSTATETAAPTPAPVPAPEPDSSAAQPSTHTPAPAPAPTNGAPDEKPVTNGVSPTTNGTNGTSPKSVANGTSTSANTTPPATPTKTPTKTPVATPSPAKEKRMRFPSLSSRSLHARSRSSAEGSGAGELGEGADSGAGVDESPKGTVRSRVGGTERAKRRSSLFGKLRDVFHHPKHETSG